MYNCCEKNRSSKSNIDPVVFLPDFLLSVPDKVVPQTEKIAPYLPGAGALKKGGTYAV